MTKCQLDPHAYYDPWGNRYLVFSDREYWIAARQVELTLLLDARFW